MEPVCCSMSSSNWCFLTCIQVSQEAGQVVWYSHLFQNFPQFIVIHTVKGFGIVKKAEIDIFLELSCFFHDPADVGNLISGSSAFSKTSLNIWKFTLHVLLKSGLENFEYYLTSMWDECNCVVVWAFFGIAFLRDWNENWPFPGCGPSVIRLTSFCEYGFSVFALWCPLATPTVLLGFLRRQVKWFGIPISFRIFHGLLGPTQSKVLAQSIKQK